MWNISKNGQQVKLTNGVQDFRLCHIGHNAFHSYLNEFVSLYEYYVCTIICSVTTSGFPFLTRTEKYTNNVGTGKRHTQKWKKLWTGRDHELWMRLLCPSVCSSLLFCTELVQRYGNHDCETGPCNVKRDCQHGVRGPRTGPSYVC